MDVLEKINKYYTEKLQTFGTTPKGVDWNSAESQHLRFEQLLNLVPIESKFSILDYGCGFGSLYPHMIDKGYSCSFTGFDLSEEMIKSAQALFAAPDAEWLIHLDPERKFDFVVSSGIFNVKMDVETSEWERYIIKTIENLSLHATKGFAFNCLTSYSDKEFMKDNLYYSDPLFLFDYCKKNFSKYVTLLHDYPLYEFTIIVKKSV